jgi:hypothetical protein
MADEARQIAIGHTRRLPERDFSSGDLKMPRPFPSIAVYTALPTNRLRLTNPEALKGTPSASGRCFSK